MTATTLSDNAARHLAARLADQGTQTSAARLHALAAGQQGTADEIDALNHLVLQLFSEYINRGGTNYDLVNNTLTSTADDPTKALAAIVQLCGRLVGRVE